MAKPTIRFKGYTDDWEQRKLGELGEILTGSTPSTSNSAYYSEDGIPWVTPTDINELTISDTPRKLSEEGAKVGRVVPANTILCTCIASIGKNALLTVKGSFNQQINSLTPSAGNDAYFLLTESELWSNKMKRMAASGTMQIVNKTEFSELDTLVPSTDEQKKIGSYFRNLDHLITLHQRKCEETKILKKYMLQKMFPQNGQKVPEIRFKGFTDDWEQRKLKEILSFLKDGTHGTHADAVDGPLLLSAKNIKDGTIKWDESDRRISQDEYEKIHSKFYLKKGDVLLTIVGSIGETAILKDSEGITFQRSVAFLRPNEDISSDFLHAKIQTPTFQKNLESRKSTSAQPGIYLGDLAEIPVKYAPSLEEQIKIGKYFEEIDHLITLHQRKCEELKNIKKFMLQTMFV
ncbi:MAG: restriction endonuclease subunit S [Mediterraneibacter faecis]